MHEFGPDDPLGALAPSGQRDYLAEYLADLGATSVVEEPHYFDRDYLSEFGAFYGSSAHGYPNVCRRLHFFSGAAITRARLRDALAGGLAGKDLNRRYLGFIVLRPLQQAPFGRTVLRWYPDGLADTTPRITTPSRDYRVHLAGLELRVHGLAWQQQDTGVSACATVALWTMLHSSAFDDHHAIPTTAHITRLAYSRGAFASRVFPSPGLTIAQICEAAREAGLEPAIATANAPEGFQPARFASVLATWLRAGYPIIVLGQAQRLQQGTWIPVGGHAVCAVGFRESAPKLSPGSLVLQDEAVQHVYLHDDNIGPGARFSVQANGPGTRLVRHPPHAAVAAATEALVPQALVTAVHENLRTSNDAIQSEALKAGRSFRMASPVARAALSLAVSVRFARIGQYMGRELATVLGDGTPALSRARLDLSERVPPLSLYVGVARIGDGTGALFDVLYDTTDNDHQVRALATVAYHRQVAAVLTGLRGAQVYDYGTVVRAF